jgi:photosystem II stability/assembly factor-like uncharacterized protein
MKLDFFLAWSLGVCVLVLPVPPCAAAGIADVLDTPAASSALAARSLINGVARAGHRIVGVGQRGHIVFSDDGGKRWTQARVPVSADLVAVSFPSARQGWAVGHDGVVLHTSDAGATWVRQAACPRRKGRCSMSGSTTTGAVLRSAPSA